ncbi:MAG: hypothetical protein ABI566_07210 [Pseudolysinimonas sp.]
MLLLIRTISLISGVTSVLNRDFNMWDAVDPFARTVLSGGAGEVVREPPTRALAYLNTMARLSGRVDDLVSRIDRGQVAVRTPDVDRRLRAIERGIGRAVFASMLFAGVLLRPTDQVLG